VFKILGFGLDDCPPSAFSINASSEIIIYNWGTDLNINKFFSEFSKT